MTKKAKPSKQNKHRTIHASPVDSALDRIGQHLVQGNYSGVVATCERVLRSLPRHAGPRAEVLAHLGTAQGLLQNFPQSYAAFTEALALDPKDAQLWYNRSMACRFTSRFGQALRDMERAIELNTSRELAEQFEEALQFSRQLAEESMRRRGPNFTLEQLIEQENHFQHGLEWMEVGAWEHAGQAFQASIALGDCLPQPWGNLGICLLMQERYDEAQAALQRALEIDPKYALAKNNLAALPEARRAGPPRRVALNEPFKHSKLKHSITFIKE